MVHEGLCVLAADEDLAHVGHIEYAHILADCIVLIDYAAVLDGHVKSGKRTHLCTKLHMEIVQTSDFQLFFH